MKSYSAFVLAFSLTASLGVGLANAEAPPPATLTVPSPAAIPDRHIQVKALVDAGKLDVARAGSYHAIAEANVRGQSSTNSSVVGYLPKGTAVTVLGRVPNSWWYVVVTEKSVGYVSAELIAVDPASVTLSPTLAVDLKSTDAVLEAPSFDKLTTPTFRSKVSGPSEISTCPIPGVR